MRPSSFELRNAVSDLRAPASFMARAALGMRIVRTGRSRAPLSASAVASAFSLSYLFLERGSFPVASATRASRSRASLYAPAGASAFSLSYLFLEKGVSLFVRFGGPALFFGSAENFPPATRRGYK